MKYFSKHLILLSICSSVYINCFSQQADYYKQAAALYRDAAAKTKCPERNTFFTQTAKYLDCMAAQLAGQTCNAAMPAGAIPDCAADITATATETNVLAGTIKKDPPKTSEVDNTPVSAMKSKTMAQPGAGNPSANTGGGKGFLSTLNAINSGLNMAQSINGLGGMSGLSGVNSLNGLGSLADLGALSSGKLDVTSLLNSGSGGLGSLLNTGGGGLLSGLGGGGNLNALSGLNALSSISGDADVSQGISSGSNLAMNLGSVLGAKTENIGNLGVIGGVLGGLFVNGAKEKEKREQDEKIRAAEAQRQKQIQERINLAGSARKQILAGFNEGRGVDKLPSEINKTYIYAVSFNENYFQESYNVSFSNIVAIDKFEDGTWPSLNAIKKQIKNSAGSQLAANTKVAAFFESFEEAAMSLKKTGTALAQNAVEINDLSIYVSAADLIAEKKKADADAADLKRRTGIVNSFTLLLNNLPKKSIPLESDKLTNSEVYVYCMYYNNTLNQQNCIVTNPILVEKFSDGTWPFSNDVLKTINQQLPDVESQFANKRIIGYFSSEADALADRLSFKELLGTISIAADTKTVSSKLKKNAQKETAEIWQ